ncbi:MAG: hypothetical protein ACD_46C00142G0001 [uncultured bacterium]|nr:MAG: hypothetical protein ACD_46C00142G0001 [uncultured bacterium]
MLDDPKIVIASSNAGKVAELLSLLETLPVEWIPQQRFDIPDALETGKTFIENAILKARHAAKLSGLPALADDSGLMVDALDGAPGVYSARYAGENASNADRIQKLLQAMQNVEADDRGANYHCILALVQHENDPAPLIFHGFWEGEILFEVRGQHGFGYDPIFYVPTHGCSAAEMNPLEKNLISHRGQAVAQLLEIFEAADHYDDTAANDD